MAIASAVAEADVAGFALSFPSPVAEVAIADAPLHAATMSAKLIKHARVHVLELKILLTELPLTSMDARTRAVAPKCALSCFFVCPEVRGGEQAPCLAEVESVDGALPIDLR